MLEIIKKIFLIGGGNLIAQLINAFSLIILTALYSPDDYGQLATFSALFTIATVISCLRYEQAIMIVKDKQELNILYSICLKLVYITTLVIFIITLCYIYLFKGNFSNLLLLLPLATFFSSKINILQNVEIKLDDPKVVGLAIIGRALITFLCQLSLFYFIDSGLIIGQLIALIIIAIGLNYRYKDKIKIRSLTFNQQEFIVLHKYKEYPKFNASYSMLSALSQNSAPLALGLIYTSNFVGLFFLAEKILRLPSTFFSIAMRQILVKHFHENSVSNGKLDNFIVFRNFTLSMLGMSLTISVMIFFLSQYFINYFFKEDWKDIPYILNCLLIWMVSIFISTPSIARLIAMNKNNIIFWNQVLDVVLKISLFLYLYFFKVDFFVGIKFYGFFSAISGFLLVFLAFKEK